MGLLNSIGIGIGAAANAAQPFIMNMQQAEIQKLRDDRMAEIAEAKDIAKEGRALTNAQKLDELRRERNIADVKAVGDVADTRLASEAMQGLIGGVGVGSSVSAEDLANLRANPEAVKAYQQAGAKGLLSASRAEELKARADAALGIGNPELAKEFEGQAKGERDERRLDQADTKEEHRFKQTMAAADRAAAAAERANENNEVAIKIKALDAQRDSIKMQYEQRSSQVKMLKQNDPNADTSSLEDDMTKLVADGTAIATQMASLGNDIKKGGAAESSSGSGKYAHLYGGDNQAKSDPSKEAKGVTPKPAPVVAAKPASTITPPATVAQTTEERIAATDKRYAERMAAEKAQKLAQTLAQTEAKKRDEYNAETEALEREIKLAKTLRAKGAPNQDRIERLTKLLAERIGNK